MRNVPSKTSISSNTANPVESTGTVMSSNIQKVNDIFANDALVKTTGPDFRVTATTLVPDTSTSKEILALADFLDRGRYPMFLAIDTTFSLRVALSRNTSFDTMLALYEEIYVLYANVSMMVDRLDPSKS